MKFVFFGSSQFSVYVLEELEKSSVLPSLIVTVPDKPKGRKLILTANVVKTWAQEKNIPVITEINKEKLKAENADFFLVAAYGKILKKEIFDIPKFKTLNIHPSLLPKYRGASPMISQILNDAGGPESSEGMGTSIMLIDEGIDTGPILSQRKIVFGIPPPAKEGGPPETTVSVGRVAEEPEGVFNRSEVLDIEELELLMAKGSVDLFVEIIEDYLNEKIEPKPQNNADATYCHKIRKEDGLLDLEGDARKNLLKIKAFAVWPRTYFIKNGKRIIVTDARVEDNKLEIIRVIPEGKKEMPYEDFLRGNM
ncbi:MAG TPA: methionyl-tRNA formyltransferase [Candidatus Paceibacterota bacterium]